MDFNFKIKYFLKNGPPESVIKLNEMLNQVELFTKDLRSYFGRNTEVKILTIKLNFQVTIQNGMKPTDSRLQIQSLDSSNDGYLLLSDDDKVTEFDKNTF